jgi:hypothetical protein
MIPKNDVTTGKLKWVYKKYSRHWCLQNSFLGGGRVNFFSFLFTTFVNTKFEAISLPVLKLISIFARLSKIRGSVAQP